MIDGNIKALIPLCREILTREDLDSNGNPIHEVQQIPPPASQARFRRGKQVPLNEKRIFGIMTPY
jgi:hypothetical protein